MRPVSNTNSFIRYPLNNILGYEANVRLLRCMIDTGRSMSHSELAEQTGLSLPGVHKVIPRLIETGIIEYLGLQGQQYVQLRDDHPLTDTIKHLFNNEKEYFDSLLNELKNQIKSLDKQPKSVWIFGKVAQGTDEYGDPIQIALLGKIKSVDSLTENFREELYHSGIEHNYDVTIDLRGITKADLETKPNLMEGKIILLYGVYPKSYLENFTESGAQKGKKHSDFDARSLSDAEIWTKLLKKYPEIISKTLNYLENRIPQIASGEKKELREWKHILESMSFQRLKKFLESDSERSVRLRQSLPFWEVLNERERSELMNTSK